jgi:ABC-2 type transport system permease protein
LGYDQFTGQTFGNQDLLINIMNYLCDDSGLISIRSRELKLRLLDMTKLASQRPLWQAINVVLPILLIIGFGLVKLQVRRKKYAKRSQ